MPYVDKGAIAVDNEQGDLTPQIVTTGESGVDLTTVGDYVVTHTVTDADGEATSVTRTVHVVDSSDHDFEVEITTTDQIRISLTGTGFLSVDGGASFTPLQNGGTEYITGVIGTPMIIKGNVSAFGINSNTTNVREINVIKAYGLSSIDNFITGASNMTEFKVAHPNVFINATSAQYFLYSCSGLKNLPEINYSNITNITYMLYNAASLKCIAGTVDFSNVTSNGYALDSCSALVAPNATTLTTLLAGGTWTNPGTCDITTQDPE